MQTGVFLIPPIVISGILVFIFLFLVIFYNKADKAKVIRAMYLYVTTITALLVFLFGIFRLGQSILNQTILPSSTMQNKVEISREMLPTKDPGIKTNKITDADLKWAQAQIDPIMQVHNAEANKNKLKDNFNTSFAMLVLGSSLFFYNKRFLKKI